MGEGPLTESNHDLFDPEFLDRLRAIFLRLKKRKKLRKKGIQSTIATGFTREFKGFRHYTPRDDYRAIDWQLFARLDRLFIRLYEEIQELHVHIVVDTSASMSQPFSEKKRTAQKLVVALGYMGLVGHHRVSLYSAGESVSDPMAPLKGQSNLQRILDFAGSLKFEGKTNLTQAFQDFRPSRRRYGIIFVISDLYGREIDEATKSIKQASLWPGEVHFLQVCHPWEEDPDLDGEIALLDVETGEERKLWFTPRDRKRYQDCYRHFLEGIEKECQARHIDYQRWRTDYPFDDLFLDLLSRGSALGAGLS